MRLRNKKTGEIDDFIFEVITDRIDLYRGVGHSDTENIYHYNSLAELNADWEDAPEEPKEYWFIDFSGEVKVFEMLGFEWQDWMKQIGNYFETKEEAEKTVEKLKAWKRLKDKGFDIESWDTSIGDDYYKTGQIVLNLNNVKNREGDEYTQINEIKNDLDLLFGGDQ